MNDKILKLEEAEETTTVDTGIFTHIFAKPVMYNGESIESATFNWGKLTGEDSLAIEKELRREGAILIAPEYSGEYIFQMMIRACEPRKGIDFFQLMKLKDYNKIRSACRTFLSTAE